MCCVIGLLPHHVISCVQRGSAPIIRALMISALMIGAQQCHPQVPLTCAQQCAH
ncbi:unnamed protein product [Staurois parvus]|uniref:Uncharacterized protein n=1 Tax=Staurois parvus TaxID=386267 RepID=A0ABN9D7A4_9NEOB|nr:unnamed protein product [Staurois parvus]